MCPRVPRRRSSDCNFTMLKHETKEGSTTSVTPEGKRAEALPHVDHAAAQKRVMAGSSPTSALPTADPTQKDSAVLNYLKSLLPSAKQPAQATQRQAQINFEVDEATHQKSRFESTADNHELSDPSVEEVAIDPIALLKSTQAEKIELERALNLATDAAVKKELHQALLLIQTREAALERINTVHDLEHAAGALAQTALAASTGEAKGVESIKRIVLESESALDKMCGALFVTREKIAALHEKLRGLEISLRAAAAQEQSDEIRTQLESFAQAAKEELEALEAEQSLLAGAPNAGTSQGAARSPAAIAEIAVNMERIIRTAEPQGDTADEAAERVRQALEKLAQVETGTHVDLADLLMRQKAMLLVEASQRTLALEGSSAATLKKVSSGLQSAAAILQDAANLPGLNQGKKVELSQSSAEILARSFEYQGMSVDGTEAADLSRSAELFSKSLSLLIAGDTSLEGTFSFENAYARGVPAPFTSQGEQSNRDWFPTEMRILSDTERDRLASMVASLPEEKRSQALNLLFQIADKRLQQHELSGRSKDSLDRCAAGYQAYQVIDRVAYLVYDQHKTQGLPAGHLPVDHECYLHARMAEARFYKAFGSGAKSAELIDKTLLQIRQEMQEAHGVRGQSPLHIIKEMEQARKLGEQGAQKLQELEQRLATAVARERRVQALYERADQFRISTYSLLAHEVTSSGEQYAAKTLIVAEEFRQRKLHEATTASQQIASYKNALQQDQNSSNPGAILHENLRISRAKEADLRFQVILAFGEAKRYDHVSTLLDQYQQTFGNEIPAHIRPNMERLLELRKQGSNFGAGVAAMLNEARSNGSLVQGLGLWATGAGVGVWLGGPLGAGIGAGVGWIVDQGINVYRGSDRIGAAFSSGVSGIDSAQTAWNAGFFALDAVTAFLPLKGSGKVASVGADAIGLTGKAVKPTWSQTITNTLGGKTGASLLGASVAAETSYYGFQRLSILNDPNMTPEQKSVALAQLNFNTGASVTLRSALLGGSIILSKAVQRRSTTQIHNASTVGTHPPQAAHLTLADLPSTAPSSKARAAADAAQSNPLLARQSKLQAELRDIPQRQQQFEAEIRRLEAELPAKDAAIRGREVSLRGQQDSAIASQLQKQLDNAKLEHSQMQARLTELKKQHATIPSEIKAKTNELLQIGVELQGDRIANVQRFIDNLPSGKSKLAPAEVNTQAAKMTPTKTAIQPTIPEIQAPATAVKASADGRGNITRRDTTTAQTKPRMRNDIGLDDSFTVQDRDPDFGSDGIPPSTRSPRQPPQPTITGQSTTRSVDDLPLGMEYDLGITWRESGHQRSRASIQNSLGSSSSAKSGGISLLEPTDLDSISIPTTRPLRTLSTDTRTSSGMRGQELPQALPQQQQSAARKRVAVADRPQSSLDPRLAELQKQMDDLNQPRPARVEVEATPQTKPLATTLSRTQQPLVPTHPHIDDTALKVNPQKLAPMQDEFEAQVQQLAQSEVPITQISPTVRPLATPQDTPLGKRVSTALSPTESPLFDPQPLIPEIKPLPVPQPIPHRQRTTITRPAPAETTELPNRRLARELAPAPSQQPELAPSQKYAPAAQPQPEPEQLPLPRTAPKPQVEPRPQPQPQPQTQTQTRREPKPQTETRTETKQRQRRRKELEFPTFDIDPTEIDRKKPVPPTEERSVADPDRAKSKHKKYTARRSKKKIVGGPVGALTLEEHQLAPEALFGAALVTKDVGGDS
jgi:hypothetical protein